MKHPHQIFLAFAMLLIASFSSAVPARAGSMLQPTVSVFDIGPVYDTHNRERIWLRVFYEVMQMSDHSWAWQVCYETAAEHKNILGNWKQVPKLYNVTYTIKISTTNILTGGLQTKTHTGTIDLDHDYYSLNYLFDGAAEAQPILTSVSVKAQRYGGQSGYSVTVNWP